MKKKPRFFCDNCGYEVGIDVKTCPYCGRFFASIRCPACEYSGPDRMFQNGCPLCGYSASSSEKPAVKHRGKKKYIYTERSLPLAYIAAGVLLLASIALFSWIITR